jgi:cation:H+ antiporter
MSSFLFYVYWLFRKQDRFVKEYEEEGEEIETKIGYLKHILIFLGSLVVVIFSAEGIIHSSIEFANILGVTEGLIGIFLGGTGVALPEIYFSIKLASKGRSWMILGGLMGAVALSSTLVLGVVALVNPIVINDFEPYIISRIFLIFSGLIFWFFVRTNNRLMKREAFILLFIYFSFLLSEFYFGGLF